LRGFAAVFFLAAEDFFTAMPVLFVKLIYKVCVFHADF
jgi:hypothetical protein